MNTKSARREAVRAYKDREPRAGIFAIRFLPTGQAWVGSARNVDAGQNGQRFSLRQGNHKDKTLQQLWRQHGEDKFDFEVVELLKPDTAEPLVPELLKEKLKHWAAELKAPVLLR